METGFELLSPLPGFAIGADWEVDTTSLELCSVGWRAKSMIGAAGKRSLVQANHLNPQYCERTSLSSAHLIEI